MTDLTMEHCQDIISKYVLQPTTCFEYETLPYSDQTIGFLGDHYKLIVKCKNEKDEISQHEFFVKAMPSSSKKFKDYVKECGLFEKESSFYKHIVPKLQDKKENFAPKCLLATETFMVLEDLKIRGFNVCNDFFQYDQWEPVLKALAKLHSASIIYEERQSSGNEKYRLNDEYPSIFKETTFVFDINHPRGRWLRNCTTAVVECLNLYPSCNQKIEVSNRILKFIFNKLPDYVTPSTKYRNVVTHADLWKNNVLFRLGDHCEHLEAMIVDYQLIRYAPPAFDVLTTIYLNSDRGFLECNFEALLNIYYGYFSTFLKMEGINPDSILSINEFIQSVEYYKLPSIIEATFFGTIVFLNKHFPNSS